MTAVQIILITLVAYLKMTDFVTFQFFAFNTIVCGWLVGLIMGDAATGLYVGATLQLMSMGVVAVGGSSMPDYPIAAIVATAIACSTGRGMEAGLAIGLPVAMLGVNFDVIYKIFNGFLMHKEMSLIEEGKFQSFLNVVKISPLFYGLCSALPVFLCVAVGPTVVNAVLDFMPFSKYWSFLIIGFVLMAYLNVPVLGVGAVGLAAAYEVYKKEMRAATAPAGAASSLGDLEDE